MTDAEFLASLSIPDEEPVNSEPPPPELSEPDSAFLSRFLELVPDEDIGLYSYRARKFGVTQIIQEILSALSRKNEHSTAIGLAEMLLRQFEQINRRHVLKLDCDISTSDIKDSDIWYSLWDALVQFVRWHNEKPLLPGDISAPLKKSEIGYRFVRQILSPSEPNKDDVSGIDVGEYKEHSKLKPGDQNDREGN